MYVYVELIFMGMLIFECMYLYGTPKYSRRVLLLLLLPPYLEIRGCHSIRRRLTATVVNHRDMVTRFLVEFRRDFVWTGKKRCLL